MIGEDDEPIAALLRDAISDEQGYQAVFVQDGALVIDTVRQVRADLLILDIMMPGLNGLEVYDRLRADADMPSMPVLLHQRAGRSARGRASQTGRHGHHRQALRCERAHSTTSAGSVRWRAPAPPMPRRTNAA